VSKNIPQSNRRLANCNVNAYAITPQTDSKVLLFCRDVKRKKEERQ